MNQHLKLASFLVLSSSFLPLAQAQNSHSLVDTLVKHWQTSKTLSLAVANAMPVDSYAFKATSEEMSFGQQMEHIAKGAANYCSAAIGSSNPLANAKAENGKVATMKDITTAYDFCIEGLQKMDDSQLMKTVGEGERQSTVFERFWGGFTHAAHHRGQAEVYLRLKGVTPPKYKF